MLSKIQADLCTSTGILLAILLSVLLIIITSHLWSALSSPGPWGVPVLGYLPFFKKGLHLQLHDLAKKYGEAYIINIAGEKHLHISSMRALKEVNINQSNNFADRPRDNLMFDIMFTDGILSMNGENWRQQRKHFLQSLKISGLGSNKDQLKGPIEETVLSTLQFLRKSRGKVIDLLPVMTKATTDTVAKLFLGQDIAENIIDKLNHTYVELLDLQVEYMVVLRGKFARYILLPLSKGYSNTMRNIKEFKSMFRDIIQKHRSSLEPDQPPRDFIDCYLLERITRDKKGDPFAKDFNDDSLIGTLVQAYGDGSSSIGILVASFLKELSSKTTVQDEIHEEIVRVIGSERLPTFEDKTHLPLLSSTIKELLRTTEIFPILPSLLSTKNTTVFGCKVPRGTSTILNLWAINHDPAEFVNPNEFDPYRYLPDKPKVEQPVNFGVGKRSCAGEGLVIAEIFLYLSAVLQNFLIIPADDDDISKKKTDIYSGFNVVAIPRSRGRFNSATGNA